MSNKYGAKKTTLYGETFDSQVEGAHYLVLRAREEAGEITDLSIHPKFVILDAFRANGKLYKATTYTADFSYRENGRLVVVDVKGMVTRDFVLRAKLFMSKYPLYRFVIVQHGEERTL